jgi:hypothetical protein
MTLHPSNFGSSTHRPVSRRGALLDASIGWNGIGTLRNPARWREVEAEQIGRYGAANLLNRRTLTASL